MTRDDLHRSPRQLVMDSAADWLRGQCEGATDEQIKDGARRIANMVLALHIDADTKRTLDAVLSDE